MLNHRVGRTPVKHSLCSSAARTCRNRHNFVRRLVLDSGDLGVPQPGGLCGEECGSLDEIRADLGDVESLCLRGTTGASERDQATSTAELAYGKETQAVADKLFGQV